MELGEVLPAKGWWASQSKMTKGFMIGIPVVALASFAIWYFGFRKTDDDKTVLTDDKKTHVESGKSDDVPSDNKSESTSGTESHSTSSHTPVQKTSTSSKIDVTKLPNGGKGCGEVKTTYDGNYDYVKCNGIWYTQSKPSPKTASKKIDTWSSLASNKVATTKLSSRYPNG